MLERNSYIKNQVPQKLENVAFSTKILQISVNVVEVAVNFLKLKWRTDEEAILTENGL